MAGTGSQVHSGSVNEMSQSILGAVPAPQRWPRHRHGVPIVIVDEIVFPIVQDPDISRSVDGDRGYALERIIRRRGIRPVERSSTVQQHLAAGRGNRRIRRRRNGVTQLQSHSGYGTLHQPADLGLRQDESGGVSVRRRGRGRIPHRDRAEAPQNNCGENRPPPRMPPAASGFVEPVPQRPLP